MTLSKARSTAVFQISQEFLSQRHMVMEEISAPDSGTWAGGDKSHQCWRPDGDHQLLSQSHPKLWRSTTAFL